MCFASGAFCTGCGCVDCWNNPDDVDTAEVQKAQKKLQAQQKGVACNCKRTKCAKKYCDCFRAGLPCGKHCECIQCKNGDEFHMDYDPSEPRGPFALPRARSGTGGGGGENAFTDSPEQPSSGATEDAAPQQQPQRKHGGRGRREPAEPAEFPGEDAHHPGARRCAPFLRGRVGASACDAAHHCFLLEFGCVGEIRFAYHKTHLSQPSVLWLPTPQQPKNAGWCARPALVQAARAAAALGAGEVEVVAEEQ